MRIALPRRRRARRRAGHQAAVPGRQLLTPLLIAPAARASLVAAPHWPVRRAPRLSHGTTPPLGRRRPVASALLHRIKRRGVALRVRPGRLGVAGARAAGGARPAEAQPLWGKRDAGCAPCSKRGGAFHNCLGVGPAGSRRLPATPVDHTPVAATRGGGGDVTRHRPRPHAAAALSLHEHGWRGQTTQTAAPWRC